MTNWCSGYDACLSCYDLFHKIYFTTEFETEDETFEISGPNGH